MWSLGFPHANRRLWRRKQRRCFDWPRAPFVIHDTRSASWRKKLESWIFQWYLKLGKERLNLAVIRSLRNRSTENVKQAVRKLVSKNDHVRKRDRQDPSTVLSLTNESLLSFLSRIRLVSTTIIPETSRFAPDSRPGMYPKPVSVAVHSYGWLYFLFIFSDPTTHMIYKYIVESATIEDFAGNGEENSMDGPAVAQCSFRQLCGIEVERTQCQERLILYLLLPTLSSSWKQ